MTKIIKKLVCVLPCRNGGVRLFGKPMQIIDQKKNITIIEHIINCLKKVSSVSEVALAISYGTENKIFEKIAKKKSIRFVYGEENDVISRMILCGKKTKATDILRITSESPFPYFQSINKFWKKHLTYAADATFLDNIIDGCGFEIISMSALTESHKKGKKDHLEHCSLFIKENFKKFKILKFLAPKKLNRKDIRLTVDYPEDLVICRRIYAKLKKQSPLFKLESIIKFLDKNPELKKMVKPYLKEGYSSMYRWGK